LVRNWSKYNEVLKQRGQREESIFGDKLYARKLGRQRTEVGIKATSLNRMMKVGMPESCAVA
jgi:hypothetical protein